MRVLMLGWEFPPVISGGIGTACYGLTKALSKEDVEILFVLPRRPEMRSASNVEVIGLDRPAAAPEGTERPVEGGTPADTATPSLPANGPVADELGPARRDEPQHGASAGPLGALSPPGAASAQEPSIAEEPPPPPLPPSAIFHTQSSSVTAQGAPPEPPAAPQPWSVTSAERQPVQPPGELNAGFDYRAYLPKVEFIEIDALLWPYRRPEQAGAPGQASEASESGEPAEQGSDSGEEDGRGEHVTPGQPERLQKPSGAATAQHGGEENPTPPTHAVMPGPDASPAPAGSTDGVTMVGPAGEAAGGGQAEGLSGSVGSEPPLPLRSPDEGRANVDLFAEVDRYARQTAQAVERKQFDVIHAHDWMTFPAAMAVAGASGRPFVAHVHSTEFDRSGHQVDQRICDIERAALHRAAKVIAVSHMTRGILIGRYSVPPDRIAVIYSAVDGGGGRRSSVARPRAVKRDEKIVLFLGRITMQKGPEYFLAAARKVLQVFKKVRFVMAGSGDMTAPTIKLAQELGLGDRVLFTGFLDREEVERLFRSADLYVMPSVSEPFGIASLEAISYDVPVLMSKQSGAAEVLRHVLKADFWDIEDIANKIVAVLRHPPLHATLKTQAQHEMRRLSWSEAARQCKAMYQAVTAAAAKRGPRLSGAGNG